MPASAKTLTVDVVALDWKWLFIYPDLGIATVNELAAPVDTPIDFKITSSSVMNSFFVPTLAGQIYAMPGMQTRLHAVANSPGVSEGFSANYSGSGFSDMRFPFRAMSDEAFAGWVRSVKAGGGDLTRARYLQLAQPSEKAPVQRFAVVAPSLYPAILNMCADPAKTCESAMMGADAHTDVQAPAAQAGKAAPSPPTRASLTAAPASVDEQAHPPETPPVLAPHPKPASAGTP